MSIAYKSNIQAVSDEGSTIVTKDQMPEEYKNAYDKMLASKKEFLDVLPKLESMTERTLETVYILDEIRKQADRATQRYRSITPTTIKKGLDNPNSDCASVTVEYAVHSMTLVTNSLTYLAKSIRKKEEDYWNEETEYEELGRITDARAYLVESASKAASAERLCRLYINKLNGSKEARLLGAIFGEKNSFAEEPFGQILKKLTAIRKYLSAVDDFSESKETDDLPDAVFRTVSLVCDFRTLLTLLVEVAMADRDVPKSAPTVNVAKVEKSLEWAMQVTALRRFSKNDFLFRIEAKEDSSEYDQKRAELTNAMQDELAEIRYNPDNFTGYHVNHVTSGKVEYRIMGQKYKGTEKDEEGNDVDCFDAIDDGPFKTREEAEVRAEEIRKALSGNEFNHADVYENPTEEFYSVIRNSDGELAIKILFPTELRAMAFLYIKARPSAYEEWLTFINNNKDRASDDHEQDGEEECRNTEKDGDES